MSRVAKEEPIEELGCLGIVVPLRSSNQKKPIQVFFGNDTLNLLPSKEEVVGLIG